MRAAIYARYSSDNQREASIEDQIRLCRERIEREGGTLIEAYTDYAISGGNMKNRPGVQSLMADAKARRFDTVIAEAPSPRPITQEGSGLATRMCAR